MLSSEAIRSLPEAREKVRCPYAVPFSLLHLRAGQAAQAHSPVHLLEKAYRWADRLAGKRGKDRASRATPPGTVEAVMRDLEALAAWCDALTQVP